MTIREIDAELGTTNDGMSDLTVFVANLMRETLKLKACYDKGKHRQLMKDARSRFGSVPRWVQQLTAPPFDWLQAVSEVAVQGSSSSSSEDE